MKAKNRIKFSLILSVFFVSVILISSIVLSFGRMDETIEGHGVISPENESIISSSVAGIIASVYLQEGHFVEKGRQVLKIKEDALAAQKEIAEAEWLRAESEYFEEMKGLHNLDNVEVEIRKAREALQKANLVLSKAKKELNQKKVLYEEGIIPLKELTDAEIEVELKESEKNTVLQEIRLLLSKKEMEKSFAKSRLAKAAKVMEVARDQLDQALKRLNESVVKAPVSGIILDFAKREGEFVSEGEKIGTMFGIEDLIFEINLSQDRIAKIKEGQEVRIFLDAFPFRRYKIFEGEIKSIAPSGQFIGGRLVFKQRVSIKEGWVDVGEKNQRIYLKPGLSGKAKIILEKDIRLGKLFFNKLIYERS